MVVDWQVVTGVTRGATLVAHTEEDDGRAELAVERGEPDSSEQRPAERSLGATEPLRPGPVSSRLTMASLEQATGLSARTIRFYITQGLLPPAHGRGPSATYDRGHLLRLLAIKDLKDRFLPLAEIKSRLAEKTDDDLAADLASRQTPVEDRWRRVNLHPDIELHVRERGGGSPGAGLAKAVEEIIQHARVVVAANLGDSS